MGDKGHTVQKHTERELENVSPRAATSGPESPAVARDGAVVIQSVRSERVRHLHFLAVKQAGPLISFQGQVTVSRDAMCLISTSCDMRRYTMRSMGVAKRGRTLLELHPQASTRLHACRQSYNIIPKSLAHAYINTGGLLPWLQQGLAPDWRYIPVTLKGTFIIVEICTVHIQ